MRIRETTISDAAAIAVIGSCVWVDTYATDGVRLKSSQYILAQFNEDAVTKTLEQNRVLVAEVNDHLVGYASLKQEGETACEIENLYVLPKFQKTGLGRKFLEQITEAYTRVWLTCWEKNHSAIRFYKTFGFIESGETYFKLRS
jgi:ribosomal protein S18 acetylase RimI-like enzyme